MSAQAAHNLPSSISSFVGQQASIAAVLARLAECRLLTLVGPGGVGKTRLAQEAAVRRVPVTPDGVWLVELAAVTEPGQVPATVRTALGLPEGMGRPRVEFLAPKTLLLVLDNCEHLVSACAELVDSLLRACPKLQVLATSREPLGILGEHLFSVPPLPVSEATQLFSSRARALVPEFVVSPPVSEICVRLEGIPLAIELAAARVRTLTPEQISARLDDRLRLLVGSGRTAPPRHHTLRAALAWSYDLLEPRDRRLFEQVAVFAGGWSLEAAEAVCGDPDVLDGLARLVNRSLVIAEHGRYRLLGTIRQFALECLAANGQLEAALERHALYWLELVERVEPELKQINQATWFRHLETEHHNLRAALRWSVASNRPDIGLRIVIAVQRFWEVRGYWSEARRWLQELLTHQRLSAQPGSRMARAVGYLGFWVYLHGEPRVGSDLLTDSLVLAEAASDASAKAFALH